MRRTVVLHTASAALAVLVLCVAALLLAQQAQAEEVCGQDVCIEKTADQSTVNVGEPVTFTITERCLDERAPCFDASTLEDTLPDGLGLVSFDSSQAQADCAASQNTVSCSGNRFSDNLVIGRYVLTIVAEPTTCGTFTNTASSGEAGQSSTTVTVVGCPTLPTTKEQCKKGGYRDFGYPDQGTCITAFNEGRR